MCSVEFFGCKLTTYLQEDLQIRVRLFHLDTLSAWVDFGDDFVDLLVAESGAN